MSDESNIQWLRRAVWACVIVSFAGAFLALGALISTLDLRDRTVRDVFGEFPDQTVLIDERDDQGRPIVHIGEAVPVEGTKCYKEEARVIGTVSWRLESPVVVVIPAATGADLKMPGCETNLFRNAWPQDAIDISLGILAVEPDAQLIWKIRGVESPATGGISATWETEPFVAVPRG